MTAAPAVSVNRRAAETVCRHASDVDDARLLLEMLGLVDESGHELVPDFVLEAAANVAQDNGCAPLVARDRPSRRDLVPEGLRNLPPAPPAPSAGRKRRRSLTEELEELERTDPEVAAAAASYDRMVERLTSKTLPKPDKDKPMPTASATEPTPAPVDLLARGLEHENPRIRKLARSAQTAVDQLVTALLAAR